MLASTTSEALAQVTRLATETNWNAWGLTSDFAVILALTAFFFFFAWYVNRGPMIAIMLSFYGAYAIYIAFPYQSLLPSAPPITALLSHAGLYAGLGFAFYIILRRLVVSDFLYIGNAGLLIIAFFGATFLVALTYHVFKIDFIYQFSPAMDALFAPKEYFFWWFVAPALALFFFAR